MVNLYIHIPFCNLKCKYCRFASVTQNQKLQIDLYVKNLILEIKKSPFKKEILNTIYFGGGTPSLLSKQNFIDIFNILKSKYIFSKNIEITLETTTNNISKEKLLFYKELGINRLSIGIQTLNKKALREINRDNGDLDILLKDIDIFDNINFDFILGLPYVGKQEILENIKYMLKRYKNIKHISVYMLEDYYNSSKVIETKYDNIIYPILWKKLGIKEKDFLGEYSEIKEFLQKNNFINYEISNFAKKGFECRHNIGYWTFATTYAFGLGAGGFIKENNNYFRYLNSDNFLGYYTGKKNFYDKLTKQDLFIENIMFELRTKGIKKENYKKLNQEKIKFFIEQNYLYFENNLLKLTNKGVLVIDFLLGELL